MEIVGILILFFVIPVSSMIWFICDMVHFIKSKEEERRKRLMWMIIAGAVTAFIIIGEVALWIFFSVALSHM